jgi:hypothetical protein
MGIGHGGYFATCLAARAPRITALITHPRIIDLHAYMVSSANFDPTQMPPKNGIRPQDIGHIPRNVMPERTREMSRKRMLYIERPSFRAIYVPA